MEQSIIQTLTLYRQIKTAHREHKKKHDYARRFWYKNKINSHNVWCNTERILCHLPFAFKIHNLLLLQPVGQFLSYSPWGQLASLDKCSCTESDQGHHRDTWMPISMEPTWKFNETSIDEIIMLCSYQFHSPYGGDSGLGKVVNPIIPPLGCCWSQFPY
jgi:hypothetical protein